MMDFSQRTELAALEMTTDRLSDIQLASLNNVANFPGYDPHKLPFYEQISHLFTEEGGTKMHAETINLLAIIVRERLIERQGETY